MAQSYYKTPQILTRHWLWSLEKRNWDMEAIYFNWQKKQAPAIFLSLTGQAKEALVSDDINTLSCDKGVETLIKEFDKLYLKDRQYSAYKVYGQFEKFCWLKSMSISKCIIEFECLFWHISFWTMPIFPSSTNN